MASKDGDHRSERGERGGGGFFCWVLVIGFWTPGYLAPSSTACATSARTGSPCASMSGWHVILTALQISGR